MATSVLNSPYFKASPTGNNVFTYDEGRALYKNLVQQNMFTDMFAQQRKADMALGAREGQKLFGEGAFGRIGEEDNKRLLEMMRGRLGGYTSGEFGALRDTMNRNLQRQYKGQQSNLAKYQGYSGVGGATASAQMQKLMADKNRSAQEGYQDFLIKNIEAKKQGAQDFGSALSSLQAIQGGNLDRKKAELMARFQTQMGYAGMGAADRAAATQSISAMRDQARADKPQQSKGLF